MRHRIAHWEARARCSTCDLSYPLSQVRYVARFGAWQCPQCDDSNTPPEGYTLPNHPYENVRTTAAPGAEFFDTSEEVVNVMQVALDYVPLAPHFLVAITVTTDGQAVRVTIDGITTDFEVDNGGGVTAGRIAIAGVGNAATIATNLAAEINSRYAARAVALADGAAGYVDVWSADPTHTLIVTGLTGGFTATPVVTPQEAEPTVCLLARRTATATDVTRGKIVLGVRMSAFGPVDVDLTDGTTRESKPWTGTVTTSTAGRITLTNAGGSPYASGDVFTLFIVGIPEAA